MTSRFRDTKLSKTGNAPKDIIDLEHLMVKHTMYMPSTYTRDPNFGSFWSTTSRFEMHGCQNRNDRITQEWSWTLNGQKYPVYKRNLPPPPPKHTPPVQIWSVSLYAQPFSKYKIVENRKCTEWPQNDLGHLAVKITLYKVYTYLRRPNVGPLHCTTSIFKI